MQETDTPTPVAVIGVGRMGRHHARTYHNMPGAELVAVVDFASERANALAAEYECEAYTSCEALLAAHPQIRAATVAVPTRHHLAAATPLMQAGIACLIEKPLAGSSAEAQQLAELAQSSGVVLQVGHTERFNPAVRALAALELTPRYIEAVRYSPMTFRSMDVGVVMDMMIHDLDIVISLIGQPLKEVHATGAPLLGPYEDLCDARLIFEGGCVASIKSSRMATQTQRTLKLFSDDAYVSLDYGTREGIVIRRDAHTEAIAQVKTQLANGEDLSDLNYLNMLNVQPLSIDLPPEENDQLTAQARAFLRSVATSTAPVVTAQHGQAAVDAAERILAAIQSSAFASSS